MTLLEALQAIAEGEWREVSLFAGGLAWEYLGESADGEPSWRVRVHGSRDKVRGSVRREIGWYEQSGDWQDYAELVRLARAMNAASKTLEQILQEAANV